MIHVFNVWLETESGERCLQVYMDISPPERDIGWAGCADLECVMDCGADITDTLTAKELDVLATSAIIQHTQDSQDGDHRY
jgi:hypothetical protein